MTKCPPGTFAGSGSSHCTMCQSKTEYAGSEGQSACQECPQNQQGSSDHTSCVCRPGFVGVYDENRNLDCQCPPGYTYESEQCEYCESGKYKTSVGNGACMSCDR